MDKLTDRYDINPPGRPLINDAMDQITGISNLVPPVTDPLHVETNQTGKENSELCVEMSTLPEDSETLSPRSTLCVEMTKLKECSVRLISLESILFPTTGQKYNTHSQSIPAVPRPGHKGTPGSSDVAKGKPALPDKTGNKSIPDNLADTTKLESSNAVHVPTPPASIESSNVIELSAIYCTRPRLFSQDRDR